MDRNCCCFLWAIHSQKNEYIDIYIYIERERERYIYIYIDIDRRSNPELVEVVADRSSINAK